MVFQSGTPPYDYAHGGRRFESKPIPLGLSGILLEQAQFAITAEIRKWTGSWHFLPDFNVYTNTNITPSGSYEPKAIGTTLDNLVNPGAAVFVDNILECRAALNTLLSLYEADTQLNTNGYRAGWLQSLFPESPSGFISGFDEQEFFDGIGHWRHRMPSETGIIDYCSDEVLGSSGVMYDIDYAEVMFNPAPHIVGLGFDDTHGRRTNGATDPFLIQQYPLFPAFQRTDGSIVDLTGREPVFLRATGYNTLHIASGCSRLHGYMLRPLTKLILSTARTFDNTPDFTFFAESIRAPFSPNVPTTVAFITPTIQSSGVYRIAAVNRFADFPTTTIESGTFSQWPIMSLYWPSDSPVNSTTSSANGGYHVFDDCIWTTDTASSAAFGGPHFGYPSGLAILSPYTGHRMWVRYAEMTEFNINVLGGTTTANWGNCVGLERNSINNIYRISKTIQRPTSAVSGQFVFGRYNDMLDFSTDITTTSAAPTLDNLVPLGGNAGNVYDFWFDGSNYFIAASQFAGFDMWKFNASFDYITKYIFNRPSGIHQARGAFVNGQNVLYYGILNNDTAAGNFATSGIFPINFITDGTDPYDNTANAPEVGEAEISYSTVKYIDGQSQIGVVQDAEIMDLFEVTSATHVRTGVYAIVRFKTSTSPFDGGNFYLLRIEEGSTSWEIKAITRMELAVGTSAPRREMLFMSY